jgi:hypothetical protein
MEHLEMPSPDTPERCREQAALSKRREHFAWQEHVAARTDLTPAIKVVLLRLALHHNVKSDRCDPSYGTLAAGAGVSERTAIRAIAEAESKGLIAVTRTTGGRHANTNSFRFILPDGVTQPSPQGVTRKAPTGDTAGQDGVTPVSPKYEREQEREQNPVGDAIASPNGRGRESDVLAHVSDPGGAGAPLRGARAGKMTSAPQEIIEPGICGELRSVWKRPWLDDEQVTHRALEVAQQQASDDDIMAGAIAWTQAVEPRFLPPLARWLAVQGWQKKPPANAAHGRASRRNRGKVSIARVMLGMNR